MTPPRNSRRPRLLADVGGTRVRFALQDDPGAKPTALQVLRVADHVSLEAAIRVYLAGCAAPSPGAAAIAIATPVTQDRIRMTNHAWSFSIAELQGALALDRLVVLNDFEALALALPLLDPAQLRPIGGGAPRAGAPMAVLGPGTGLGVATLVPCAGGFVALPGEGGHVSLAATDDEEDALIALLRRRFGHVSAERALSGPGLQNLYVACCERQQRQAEALSASEITERAESGSDPACSAAVGHFLSFLGSTAGNLALTVGALGGVFIGGGIVPRLGIRVEASRFRERFEAKGRFGEYLRSIPTQVIDSAFPPALLGAAAALER